MVQTLRREPLIDYVLRDAAGRVIGVVRAPAGGLQTGPGAETVLLIRGAALQRLQVPAAA
jgi:hypothetical protein